MLFELLLFVCIVPVCPYLFCCFVSVRMCFVLVVLCWVFVVALSV